VKPKTDFVIRDTLFFNSGALKGHSSHGEHKHVKFEKLEGKVRASARDHGTVFLIYEEGVSFLDAIGENGKFIERYEIKDSFYQHNLQLDQLTFICFPVLEWSSRLTRGFGGKQKKIIISGEVSYEGKTRTFIMVYNLE